MPRQHFLRIVLMLLVSISTTTAVAKTKPHPADHLVKQATEAEYAGNYAEAARLLQEAVDQGNALAMNNLGFLYERGRGVAQDYSRSFELYLQGAKAGNDEAMLNVGKAYRYGWGVKQHEGNAKKWLKKVAGMKRSRKAAGAGIELKKPKPLPGYADNQLGWRAYDAGDFGTAHEHWLKAAEAGHHEAMYQVGYNIEQGHGVPQDIQQAIGWYKKAAKAKNEQADDALKRVSAITGEQLQASEALNRADYASAVELWRKAGAAGQGYGYYNLGHAHLNGWAVTKDEREAQGYFRLAAAENHPGGLYRVRKEADRGDVNSMLFLADLYLNSKKVPYDGWTARELYQQAIYAGSAEAQRKLASLSPVPDKDGEQEYQQGEKAPWKSRERFDGYLKAANKGHLKAIVAVAEAYRTGEGITSNEEQARLWYSRGARGGSLYAMQNYAGMLATGMGGPQDGEAALAWNRLAADAGHQMSMWGLAMMYSHGMGIPKNDQLAVYWLEIAAAHGSVRAEQSLIQRGLRKDIWAERAAAAKAQAEANRRQQAANNSQFFGNLTRIWAYHNAPSGSLAAGNQSDNEFWAKARARSECMKKVSNSIQRQTYGQQTWRYVNDC